MNREEIVTEALRRYALLPLDEQCVAVERFVGAAFWIAPLAFKAALKFSIMDEGSKEKWLREFMEGLGK